MCRGGWVVVTVSSAGGGPTYVERILDLTAVIFALGSGALGAGR